MRYDFFVVFFHSAIMYNFTKKITAMTVKSKAKDLFLNKFVAKKKNCIHVYMLNWND